MPLHQPAHMNPCSPPNLSTAYGLASSPGLGLYTSLVKIEDYESRGMKRKRIQVVEEVEAASALLSFSNTL
ncbi:hypothetical protein [Phaffia rhodozyma]|uniref:Uncharacterized protein n=1 Tax=Phaffia rhodozyma TaxID=264483 RepID=A0A0F7SMC2_PHARH|nr:hypothetical protein [Phaffia rhodozyma]